MNDETEISPRRPLSSESLKARLLLTVACLWPLMLLALLASSAPPVSDKAPLNGTTTSSSTSSVGGGGGGGGGNLRLSIRNALDRVDIMGYGPTHPRIAVVVVVGNDQTKDNDIVTTIKSVISNTDLQRIFVMVVVVDGKAADDGAALERELRAMEEGSIPHWHGTRADVHEHNSKSHKEQQQHEETEHGRKLHVLFNKEAIGTSASREDAVDFVHLLASYHEQAGLKSPAEDLILLLMEPGAQLQSHKWLSPVTQALIVPPPLLPRALQEETAAAADGTTRAAVSLKMANAVVFPTTTGSDSMGQQQQQQGQRTSLDLNLAPVDTQASVQELNGSSGDSWMSPAWDGVALAMRLETYRNLPLPTAVETLNNDVWSANLDVAMALWLCADGMDVLAELEVSRAPHVMAAAGLSPAAASRFAAAWMEDVTSAKFFQAYHKIHSEVTLLDWNLWHAHSDAVWRNSRPHCRSFQWYMDNVNTDMREALRAQLAQDEQEQSDQEEVHDATQEQQGGEMEKFDHGQPAELKTDDGNSVVIPERREPRKPSKPLCDECLSIVQQAKPIDISFVDVSDGHHDHPHLGAMDVDGNLGYVHDAAHLHQNPPAFGMPKDKLAKACAKRDNNYRMLTEKVYVDMAGQEAAEKSGKRRAKIFCLVYTIESGHDRVRRIRETWGQKCDGFMVGSTKTDPSIDTVNIPHEGPEEYNNIWQKVRSMWAYIYDNYYNDHDFFHIGGDDLYVIVENLRLYLESEEVQTAANGGIYLPDGSETSQTPLFMGRRFAYQGDMNDIFISGGSGYTMNKAALKALVTEGLPNMFPHAHTFSEDTMIARLFRKKFGVLPYETKDEAGGERYMPFMPGHHWGYRLPDDPSKDWYAKYSINIKEGPDHCAAKSVAFHYVKNDDMYRLHALLYHLCPSTG